SEAVGCLKIRKSPELALGFEQFGERLLKPSMEIVRYTLYALGSLLICISLIPLLPSSKWFVRVFDYPRSQKFWLSLIIMVLYLVLIGPQRLADTVFLIGMLLNQIYLFRQIWDYTQLAPIQMKSRQSGGEKIRLLVANVYQDNRDASRCLNLINTCDPDMILLVETDQWWCEAVTPIFSDYPHRIMIPLENTYGMVFLSRLELTRQEVRY